MTFNMEALAKISEGLTNVDKLEQMGKVLDNWLEQFNYDTYNDTVSEFARNVGLHGNTVRNWFKTARIGDTIWLPSIKGRFTITGFKTDIHYDAITTVEGTMYDDDNHIRIRNVAIVLDFHDMGRE